MKCKYCGLSAGVFSHAHKECEEKHKQGIAELLAYLNSYFNGTDSMSCVLSIKKHNILFATEIIQGTIQKTYRSYTIF